MACPDFVHKYGLLVLTGGSAIISIILGVSLQYVKTWTERECMYLAYVGTIYLRILKCLVVPLIFPTIICAVGESPLGHSRAVAWRAGIYYLTTAVLACLTTLFFVTTIRPGEQSLSNRQNGRDESKTMDNTSVFLAVDIYLDLIRNLFPSNPITAAFWSTKTIIRVPTNLSTSQLNSTSPTSPETWEFDVSTKYEATNMIGLVGMAIAVGVATNMTEPTSAAHLLNLCRGVSSTAQVLVEHIIWMTPFAVGSLLIADIVVAEDLVSLLQSLSWFILSVLLTIGVHGFLIVPGVFFLVCRRNPYTLLYYMRNALLTVFSTASSIAGLPQTMEALKEYGAEATVVNLCLPIGTTIIMDASAMYEGTASVFLAQMEGGTVTFSQSLSLVITATLCSIGVAVPSALIVIIQTVLNIGGIGSSNLNIILITDWLIDRLRTVTNVYANACIAVAISTVMERKKQAKINSGAVEEGEEEEG